MLIDLLNKYSPSCESEISHKKEMINLLTNHSNEKLYSRERLEGHFTSSIWLLNTDFSKALLMHHKKLGIWVQLGGHCDGDSNMHRVALKEAEEESGISGLELVNENIFDIDIHKIPQKNDIPEHFHYDVRFLIKCTTTDNFIQNHESNELRWISSLEEIPTNNSTVIRMFDKWKNSIVIS